MSKRDPEYGTAPFYNAIAYETIELLTEMAIDEIDTQMKTGTAPGYEPLTWDVLRQLPPEKAAYMVAQMIRPLGDGLPNPRLNEGLRLAIRLRQQYEGGTDADAT